MTKSRREAYFKLAELLAILSGTLLIGAGLFSNASATYHSAIQTNVGLIYEAKVVEPNAEPYLQTSNKLLGELVNATYTRYNLFLWSGIIFLLVSLASWGIGVKVDK